MSAEAVDDEEDAARQVRCIQTRRRRKCIAEGAHTEGGCERCGL